MQVLRRLFCSSVSSSSSSSSVNGTAAAAAASAAATAATASTVQIGTHSISSMWLRDHCRCPKCIDLHSGQRLHNIISVDPQGALKSTVKHVTQASGHDATRVIWGDGHESLFSHRWLSANAPGAAGSHGRAAREYNFGKTWDGDSFKMELIPYAEFKSSRATRLECMERLSRDGLLFFSGVPVEDGRVTDVATEVAGRIRDTFYGRFWNVRAKAGAENLAYTSIALPLHLDLLYFEAPPGLQFLHSHESNLAEGGGETYFVDGHRVLERLHREHPEHYKTLASTKVTYHYRVGSEDREYTRPIVMENWDNPFIKLTLAYSPPWLAPLRLAPEQVEPFYAAFKVLSGIMESPRSNVDRRLMPGECVVFNNRRVLHARRHFKLGPGDSRLLQGCYADLEDFHSTLCHLRKTSPAQ